MSEVKEEYPVYQTSIKHGPNDSAMTVVRGYSEREFRAALELTAENANQINETVATLRAESVVTQSFPGTTRMDSQNNPAPAYKEQPAQGSQGFNTPTCDHGVRIKRSGGSGRDAWEGWFCPLDKTHPERCKPLYPNRR